MMIKKISVISVFLYLLSACGQSSDTVTVTLKTGLPENKNFNLMENFSAKNLFIGGTCVQKYLFAGFKSDPNAGDSAVLANAVTLTTPLSTTINYSWLTTAGNFNANIPLQVPKGIPVEFGMKGVLTDTSSVTSADADGTCPIFTTGGSSVATTLSMTGHSNAQVAYYADANVALSLMVLDSPTSVPSPSGVSTNCAANANDLNCPVRNYLKFSCSSSCTSGTYFITGLGGKISQFFTVSSGTGPFNYYILRHDVFDIGQVSAGTKNILYPNVSAKSIETTAQSIGTWTLSKP